MVWYYVKEGARQGPVEEAEFSRLVAEAVVKPDTLVWSEGMSDWRPYSAVAPPVAAPVAQAPVVMAAAPVQTFASPVVEQRVVEQRVEALQPAAPAASAAVQPHFCSQCGRQYPSEELVRFGTATVCANCKEVYAQRLRETGQVAGARVYGGFWIRFLAIIIDGIVLWIVNFALQTVTGTRITSVSNFALVMSTIGLNMLISTAIAVTYEAFFLVQYGATPGKMVLKLKVITPDGGGISWGRAIGRYFAKMLSAIILMIGYIMAGFDSEKRALHDYIAGTRVIRVP